jgi:hypothetical protein
MSVGIIDHKDKPWIRSLEQLSHLAFWQSCLSWRSKHYRNCSPKITATAEARIAKVVRQTLVLATKGIMAPIIIGDWQFAAVPFPRAPAGGSTENRWNRTLTLLLLTGVEVRRDYLFVNLKNDHVLQSPRMAKSERLSAKRFLQKVKLASPKEVDAEFKQWLKHAYEVSGFTTRTVVFQHTEEGKAPVAGIANRLPSPPWHSAKRKAEAKHETNPVPAQIQIVRHFMGHQSCQEETGRVRRSQLIGRSNRLTWPRRN